MALLKDYSFSFLKENGQYKYICDLATNKFYENTFSPTVLNIGKIIELVNTKDTVGPNVKAETINTFIKRLMDSGKNYSIFVTGFDYDPFTYHKQPKKASWVVNPHILLSSYGSLVPKRLDETYISGKITRVCYYDIKTHTRFIYETGFVGNDPFVENMFIQRASDKIRHEGYQEPYNWNISKGWHYLGNNFLSKFKSNQRDKNVQISPETFYPFSLMYWNETDQKENMELQIRKNVNFFSGVYRQETFTTFKILDLLPFFPKINITDATTAPNNWSLSTKKNICGCDEPDDPDVPTIPEDELSKIKTKLEYIGEWDISKCGDSYKEAPKLLITNGKINGKVSGATIVFNSTEINNLENVNCKIAGPFLKNSVADSIVTTKKAIIGKLTKTKLAILQPFFKESVGKSTLFLDAFELKKGSKDSGICVHGTVVVLNDDNKVTLNDGVILGSNTNVLINYIPSHILMSRDPNKLEISGVDCRGENYNCVLKLSLPKIEYKNVS